MYFTIDVFPVSHFEPLATSTQNVGADDTFLDSNNQLGGIFADENLHHDTVSDSMQSTHFIPATQPAAAASSSKSMLVNKKRKMYEADKLITGICLLKVKYLRLENDLYFTQIPMIQSNFNVKLLTWRKAEKK